MLSGDTRPGGESPDNRKTDIVGSAVAQIARRLGAGKIIGPDTPKLDLIAVGDILEALRPGFDAGDCRPTSHCRNICPSVLCIPHGDGLGRAGRGKSPTGSP
jgi:hypothetical protein